MDLWDSFNKVVSAEMRRQNELIEAACVRALYYGCGVRIYDEPFEVFADPEVPKGKIFRYSGAIETLTRQNRYPSGLPMDAASGS